MRYRRLRTRSCTIANPARHFQVYSQFANYLILPSGLRDLKERALETYSRLPAIIHYSPIDITGANTDGQMPYPRLVLRLEHLQNILFIERLLLRHGKQDRSDIIATSFELVSNTLVFWTHRERLSQMRDDRDWVVSLRSVSASPRHPCLVSDSYRGHVICRPCRRHPLPRTP